MKRTGKKKTDRAGGQGYDILLLDYVEILAEKEGGGLVNQPFSGWSIWNQYRVWAGWNRANNWNTFSSGTKSGFDLKIKSLIWIIAAKHTCQYKIPMGTGFPKSRFYWGSDLVFLMTGICRTVSRFVHLSFNVIILGRFGQAILFCNFWVKGFRGENLEMLKF